MDQVNRYNRQHLIWGPEGQAKLSGATIAIIGEDEFCFPAALNAALLGLNTRLLIAQNSTPGSYALDFQLSGKNLGDEYARILTSINPLVHVSHIATGLESAVDKAFLEGADVIIDVTNNIVSKGIALEFSLERGIPLISASSVPGFAVVESNIFSPHTDAAKDNLLAYPVGALVIELAKRQVMGQFVPDEPLYINPSQSYPFVQHTEEVIEPPHDLSKKTCLVVGVGGQGSFAIPILIQLGYKVIYMDPDSVQDHNLNRQPWYWDSVGQSKAEVCARKHNLVAGYETARAMVQRFDEHTTIDEEINLVFGFTDTMYSRMLLSNFAARRKIPFIAAGSDPGGADISLYVPGKTSCYTHLYQSLIPSAKEGEQRARHGCMENPNAQVVMPNCFAGSLAAVLSAYLFNENYSPFNGRLLYRPDSDPSFGRLTHPEICSCHSNGPIDLSIN